VECPDCEQEDLRHFSIPSRDEVGVCCPECDAMWIAGRLLPFPGHDRISWYLNRLGLGWDEVELGPSTEQVPALEGVIVNFRVRPESAQPLIYVVGDTGQPRTPCAYCPSGYLVDAVLQPTGEGFVYCVNCEAVWTTRDPVAEQPPTFLGTYLQARNAEWSDVTNAGEPEGWHGLS
jgi:hypothetical protein